MMLRKIVFAFLLVCLLAIPGSAWHLSFEGHTNELSSQYYSYPELTPVAYNNNNVLEWYCIGNTKSIFLNISYTDYLSMTIIPITGNQGGYFGIKLYDSENNVLINTYGGGTAIDYAHTPFRLEFIETSSGAGIETYKDGVLIDSDSYTASGTPVRMEVIFGSSNLKVYVDDLSNEYGVVGSDYELRSTDTYQYYTLGFPVVSNSAWYAKIYDNNGNLVNNTGYLYSSTNTVDDSPLGHTYSIARANLTIGGTYSIRLFRYDSTLHTNTFYAEEIFYYDMPENGVLSIDKSEVNAGDRVRVYVHMNTYEEGMYYSYILAYSDGTTKTFYTFLNDGNLTEEYNGISYIDIPENIVSGTSLIELKNSDNEVVDSEYLTMYATGLVQSPVVQFYENTYDANDLVRFTYGGADSSTNLVLRILNGNVVTASTTYSVTGGGSKTYQLNSSAAAGNTIELIMVDSTTSAIEAYDTASILSGSYSLEGKVIDAYTKAAINGATVYVGGKSDTTDSEGSYLIEALSGKNTVSVTASGYNDYSGKVNVFDMFTTKNFYLAPILSSTTGSLSGIVTSKGNGYPLEGARVRIVDQSNLSNNEIKYTDSAGYYQFTPLVNSTYSISVSLSNYVSYSGNISVSGNTYKGVQLSAISGYEEEGSEPDSNSGSIPQDVDTTNYSDQPYGAMGRHPFDFNGDGDASADEWKYAFERLIILVGCLCFMGFLGIVGRAGRR